MKTMPVWMWPGCVLILLFALNAVVNPAFFSFEIKDGHIYGSIVDILLRGSPLILVSLGMTLVIATGGIDLSVGTTAALSSSVAAFCFMRAMNFSESFTLAILTGLIIGTFNSILIVVMNLQPIIASLVAMVTGRGIAQLLIDGQIIPIRNSEYLFLGNGYVMGLPFIILFTILFLSILIFVSQKTAASIFIEAVGSNVTAANYTGLNTRLIRTVVYCICGITAAIAGVALSSNIRSVDVNNLGLFLELDAILAVVIGGTHLTGGRFSLIGSALGALIIQTVSTTINTQGIAIQAMLMVKASVVILICLLQSEKFRNKWRLLTSRVKT